jgi:hypothetical protein
MSNNLYAALVPVLMKAVGDSAYRDKLLRSPNETISAEGIPMGPAKIDMSWVESTNCLNVQIKNAGANWAGAILLKLEK